jgi:SAM-dependent methyltransferase
VEYARNYERCCIEQANFVQRLFIGALRRKARQIGQDSHKIWSLKYAVDAYCAGKSGLTVLDCGAWNGWFLSYDAPQISQRIALDFDPYYARALEEKGIRFLLADMEKGRFPLADASIDLAAMTSTLEHLSCPEHAASELHRVLTPGGVVFITVPNILKYKFHFWDDVTHKRPFSPASLRFLFESHGFHTEDCMPYNHNLFIAGNLFPPAVHRLLMRFRGKAILYAGRKP